MNRLSAPALAPNVPNTLFASTSTRSEGLDTVTDTVAPKNCCTADGFGPPPVALVPTTTPEGPWGPGSPSGPWRPVSPFGPWAPGSPFGPPGPAAPWAPVVPAGSWPGLKSPAMRVPLRTSLPVSELLRTSRPVTVLSLIWLPVIRLAAARTPGCATELPPSTTNRQTAATTLANVTLRPSVVTRLACLVLTGSRPP